MTKKKLNPWERMHQNIELQLADVIQVKRDEEGDMEFAKCLVDEVKLDVTASVNFTLTVDRGDIEGWVEQNDGDIQGAVGDLMNELDSELSSEIEFNSFTFSGFVCDASVESGGWIEAN